MYLLLAAFCPIHHLEHFHLIPTTSLLTGDSAPVSPRSCIILAPVHQYTNQHTICCLNCMLAFSARTPFPLYINMFKSVTISTKVGNFTFIHVILRLPVSWSLSVFSCAICSSFVIIKIWHSLLLSILLICNMNSWKIQISGAFHKSSVNPKKKDLFVPPLFPCVSINFQIMSNPKSHML